MLKCEEFFNCLKTGGVDFFTGVPDSLLKNICAYITDHVEENAHVIAANEGGAIGLAIGHYLATANPALVYMQNSGQGNIVNPLMSLADKEVYGIPMLLLVGWRGEPEIKDEPQHIKQGKVTIPIFEAMGIHHMILPEQIAEAQVVVKEALRETRERGQPVALLVRKGTFDLYALQKKPENPHSLSREEAIRLVVQSLDENATLVSTTGKASRELFEIREIAQQGHQKDFLTVGGMGHASQIALGIALAQPNRTVCCLDGDGAALMHAGGMGIIGTYSDVCLKHILLNNGTHDSVGGQPTIGFSVNFCDLARSMGYSSVLCVESADALREELPHFLSNPGLGFLEIRVAGGARDDLGRPTTTPAENKQAIMEFLCD